MVKTKDTPKKTSKFIREYGITLKKLADKYTMSSGYLYLLHLKGELHAVIAEQEQKETVEVGE